MSSGTVERIWIKRSKGGPMDQRDEAEVQAGRGFVGDANLGSRRQITLIEEEKFEEMARELNADLDRSWRRANILVKGISLTESSGKILQVGGIKLRILGETRPCSVMDRAFQGLRAAMQPDWRGGAYSEALDDGLVQIGDAVVWGEDEG